MQKPVTIAKVPNEALANLGIISLSSLKTEEPKPMKVMEHAYNMIIKLLILR